MSLNIMINNRQLLLVWFDNITRQPQVQTLVAALYSATTRDSYRAHNGLRSGKLLSKGTAACWW